MKPKKQLKQLKKFIHDELVQAKVIYNNGCFHHDSIKEEAIAKAKYETLKLIAKKAIELKNSWQINTFGQLLLPYFGT